MCSQPCTARSSPASFDAHLLGTDASWVAGNPLVGFESIVQLTAEPAWVAYPVDVLRAVAQREVAVGIVASEDHYAFNVFGDRLVGIAGFLLGADVGEYAVNDALEGVGFDFPDGIRTALAAVETLDELSVLATIDNEAARYHVFEPFLVGLAVGHHILSVRDVVEGAALQGDGLNQVFTNLGGLLSAL